MQGKVYLINILCALVGLVSESFGQCFPDRHSTNWYDGWISCEPFPSPNPQHGLSHWILYDFGQMYSLKETRIWNTNDPNHLNRGIKEAVLDVSDNGVDWVSAGTYSFHQGTGKSIYQGFEGPDLSGLSARYVLITALDNWGGACFGLSEIRFEAGDATTSLQEYQAVEDQCFVIETYPNPFTVKSRVIVQTQCDSPINFRVTDIMGRSIKLGEIGGSSGYHNIELDGANMVAGNYLVTIRQGSQSAQKLLIKME